MAAGEQIQNREVVDEPRMEVMEEPRIRGEGPKWEDVGGQRIHGAGRKLEGRSVRKTTV